MSFGVCKLTGPWMGRDVVGKTNKLPDIFKMQMEFENTFLHHKSHNVQGKITKHKSNRDQGLVPLLSLFVFMSYHH